MKKSYCLKIKKKRSQKKLRKKSGRRESPVFCIKIIRQKFAFLKISSILKTETEKRTQKAKSKRSCRGPNPQFSFMGNTPLQNICPFFVWQDRWL